MEKYSIKMTNEGLPTQIQGDEPTIEENHSIDELTSVQKTPDNKKIKTGFQESLQEPEVDPKRVIEAALFIANRSFTYAELSLLAKVSVAKGKTLVLQLQKEYESGPSALEVTADAINVGMQVKGQYLGSVSHLSKNIEITKKALKIIALIAKKGKLKQSSLHQYFRGDIYSYVSELKDLGYLSSEKSGNTKILKPTSKFKENFQISQEEDVGVVAPTDPEKV